MNTPNEDLLATARSNVADNNCPAHRGDIMRGLWDGGTLVRGEVARLLREPIIAEGEEA